MNESNMIFADPRRKEMAIQLLIQAKQKKLEHISRVYRLHTSNIENLVQIREIITRLHEVENITHRLQELVAMLEVIES